MLEGKKPMEKDEPSLFTKYSTEGLCRPLHILLAEDSLINQKVAIHILEKQGHRISVADNGKSVLYALKRECFDLVLMDIQMPKMNGLEVTASIRKKEKITGTHIPIIAITAHGLKGDRERYLEAGLDDYITKPIKQDELIKTVNRVILNNQKELQLQV